ncbi:hypothetical protein H5410_064525 [Solanum commersonii]|uniref:Ubiquitin-like protease family profile domain-containing protein n=1 Tax=Solanum commersonii TaxID=4109 RepID=A0A9J5VZU3_SOLCO|nr:hypothetical protein H5410_064525 [Solanum commersonii]
MGRRRRSRLKDAKTRNRLPQNVILPESRYPAASVEVDKFWVWILEPEVDRKFWKHPDVVYISSRWSSYTNHSDNEYQITNRDFYLVESGHRLLASTSWDKVDYILFPLNIKEGCHWILVVFDIVQRSLEKIEFHFITKGVPRQQDDSLDCGVFVATFAEFVSNGQHILNQQVKGHSRKRFGAILWEYARRKQASDLESEGERGKIKKYSYIS